MKRLIAAVVAAAVLSPVSALAAKPEQGPNYIEPGFHVSCETNGTWFFGSFPAPGVTYSNVYYRVVIDGKDVYFDGTMEGSYLTLANSMKKRLDITIGMSEFGTRTFTYYRRLC